MAEKLSIRRLIDRITSGDIRIPAFQREFVWEPEQVAFLLDSIYKEYPIGTVIFWKTDIRLETERNLGSFELPDPARDYPVNYVLDGQQRLTSIFSTFQNELTPYEDSWIEIYFDIEAANNAQESVFLPLEQDSVNTDRHFPVKTLFDTVAYRKATEKLPDNLLLRIDDLQSKFKEYSIPNEIFETSDRDKVAIVFERINRAGTDLKVFELLSAWSWSEDFDLSDKFNDLQYKIAEHGYEDLTNDTDLQLRICAGVITGETSPSKIFDLQGEDIRRRFDEIENGIVGAIDFLKRELNVNHFKMLPFPGVLVPLSCFFATDKSDGQNYTSSQKDKIIIWFWRSIFSRRFSADVNRRQAHDISEMTQLRNNEKYNFKFPKPENNIDFGKSNFSAGNANSKSLMLLLNSMSPHSLISGAKIDTTKVLKKGSKHEFHHIFPRDFLAKKGLDRREINVLANICFLTRSDNNIIKNKPPSIYLEKISNETKKGYLAEALCPNAIESLEYDAFIMQRSEMLTKKAYALMQH